METMIDQNLVKKMRTERAWSQEELASISGLSLRTIQRVEKEGSGSLESKKALASAFEVDVNDLHCGTQTSPLPIHTKKGRKYGLFGGIAGGAIGLAGAYGGITLSLVNDYITTQQAGLYYGAIAGFCGLSFAIIGMLYHHGNQQS